MRSNPVFVGYTPWRFSIKFQSPYRGSRWYYGNFALGLTLDSHPRFWNLAVCCGFIEVLFLWERDAIIEQEPQP